MCIQILPTVPILSFLEASFNNPESNPGSNLAFRCHLSFVSHNLEVFLCFFISLYGTDILEDYGPDVCRVCFSLGLPECFLRITLRLCPLAGMSHEGCCVPFTASCRRHLIPFSSLLVTKPCLTENPIRSKSKCVGLWSPSLYPSTALWFNGVSLIGRGGVGWGPPRLSESSLDGLSIAKP